LANATEAPENKRSGAFRRQSVGRFCRISRGRWRSKGGSCAATQRA